MKIEDSQKGEAQLAEQSIQLAEWAAKMLIDAEQLGIKNKPVARFPLPGAERAVLMTTPTVDEKIQKKLAAKNPKLTIGEVGGLLMAVAEAMLDAPPMQGFALIMTAKQPHELPGVRGGRWGRWSPPQRKGHPPRSTDSGSHLADIEPGIWRLVEVPDSSLSELHDVIQVAMGWQNCHMHQFILNGKYYGQATSGDLDLEAEDEDGIRLSQIFTGRKKPRIVYEYDFGDGWRHEIALEKTLEPATKVKYPRCLEGARACPPEDCGGPWGYADFLEAISDPKHPGPSAVMKQWIGGRFDPEKFSMDRVEPNVEEPRVIVGEATMKGNGDGKIDVGVVALPGDGWVMFKAGVTLHDRHETGSDCVLNEIMKRLVEETDELARPHSAPYLQDGNHGSDPRLVRRLIGQTPAQTRTSGDVTAIQHTQKIIEPGRTTMRLDPPDLPLFYKLHQALMLFVNQRADVVDQPLASPNQVAKAAASRTDQAP